MLGAKEFAELDEGPDDANAGLHSHRAIEDAGEHGSAVFGEDLWNVPAAASLWL